MLLKMQESRGCRHQSTTEEVFRHPVKVIFHFKRIMQETVTENMTPEQAIGFEPATDIFEQFLIIAHMLKHFDRNHTVKSSRFQLQYIDVTGDHRQVIPFF